MHILILTEAFPPETKSASTLFFELAESFVKRGHKVSVVTRKPRYNIAEGTIVGQLPACEILSGIEVYRFSTPPLARHIPFIRGLEHFLLAFIFFLGALRVKDFDLILVYSPPLPLGISGYWLGRLRTKPVVVNIQDLFPQAVIVLGLLRSRLLIKIARLMESFIYGKSDLITVHSEGNRKYVIGKGANSETTEIVHNWVDTDLIKPGNRENNFSRQYGLINKFVVSFAGVMGFPQGLEVVIDAANILKNERDIQFVLVGDGVKKPELEEMAKSLELQNVWFVPTQPLNIYPQVLYASDACLVTLRKDMATPVVPGKMLSIMAAGKPVLASLPLKGDAPGIIRQFNCGLAVEAGDPRLLADAVLKLYNNQAMGEELGQNGRKAAEKHFSREVGISKYECLFNAIIKGKS